MVDVWPLDSDEGRRRLDAATEVAKNGRTVFLILNVLVLYVFLSLVSLKPPQDVQESLNDLVQIYSHLEESIGFDDVVAEAPPYDWDWGQRFILMYLSGHPGKRSVKVIEGKNISDFVIETNTSKLPWSRKNVQDNIIEEQLCKKPSNGLIIYSCQFRNVLYKHQKAMSDWQSISIGIDASPLKGKFRADIFIFLSVFMIAIIYLYLCFLFNNYMGKMHRLDKGATNDLMKDISHPSFFYFYKYGNDIIRIVVVLLLVGPSIFVMNYIVFFDLNAFVDILVPHGEEFPFFIIPAAFAILIGGALFFIHKPFSPSIKYELALYLLLTVTSGVYCNAVTGI